MREITQAPELPGLAEVQEYLYPKPMGKSKKYVLVPSNHNIWVGQVVCAPWGNPRTNYEMLRFVFDNNVHKPLVLKLPYSLIQKHKIFLFYLNPSELSEMLDEGRVDYRVQDEHKFYVHFPDGYSVDESKLMRTGTMGVLCVEETLERFKEDRLRLL